MIQILKKVIAFSIGAMCVFMLMPEEVLATVSFVSAATSTGTNIIIPSHRAGDLIVVYAYRYSNATPPTLGQNTFYRALLGGGNANVSTRVAWAIATNTNESSGAWTNATGMMALVYRGAFSVGSATTSLAASGTNCFYPGMTSSSSPQTSWFVRLATRASKDNLLQTNLPNSMALRWVSASSGAPFQVAVDSNSGLNAVPAASTVACGAANSAYNTASFELLMTPARKMRLFSGYRINVKNGRITIYPY